MFGGLRGLPTPLFGKKREALARFAAHFSSLFSSPKVSVAKTFIHEGTPARLFSSVEGWRRGAESNRR